MLPGGEPSPCVSWEKEVGKLLKMATALLLPGTPGLDSPGPSSVWDPPASHLALSSHRRTMPPPALPGMLCPAGGALQSTSAMLGSMLFLDHLQLP